jgi:hypothetical protein
VLDSLETHVFPVLGKLPIREITAPMVLSVLRVIEGRPVFRGDQDGCALPRQKCCRMVSDCLT